MKRHGGNFNAYERKSYIQLYDTGKGRTMETVKRSVVVRNWGEGGVNK